MERRDAPLVAAKLRALAHDVEHNTLGALTLATLGDIFGTEFWELIFFLADEKLNSISNCLGRIAEILERRVQELPKPPADNYLHDDQQR